MQSEVISLPDYIHAFQVVLGSVSSVCPGGELGKVVALRSQAADVLIRVEFLRRRLGACAVDQDELQQASGCSLPGRVIVWLADCRQRIAAGEGAPLVADVLALSLALEKTLRASSCRRTNGATSPAVACREANRTAFRYRHSEPGRRRGRP
jgi:hypothetical protein